MERQTTIPITPDTKVGPLLDAHPELEAVLVKLSPAFVRLKNPVLRKTVAKVATLRQVASVGNISLSTLINELRKATGQEPATQTSEVQGGASRLAWLESARIARVVDAGEMLDRGEHPGPLVMGILKEVPEGDCVELRSPFRPAPLIALADERGYESWSGQKGPEAWVTYLRKRLP